MARDTKIDQPWLNGEPYYCALCGAGGPERMACEEGDCRLETKAEAMRRRQKALQQTDRCT